MTSVATMVDDPLSAFWSAVGQVMGWALLIFATALCGLWLGLSYKQGELIPFDVALNTLVMATFAWLAYPQLVIAIAFSVLAWYVSLKSESTMVRIGSASANSVVWFAAAVWAT